MTSRRRALFATMLLACLVPAPAQQPPDFSTELPATQPPDFPDPSAKQAPDLDNPEGLRCLSENEPCFGIHRSRMGYEKSTTNSGPATFHINQGFILTKWETDRTRGYLRGNYAGGYDFNTGNESGPIVSKVQNPSVFFEFDGKKAVNGLLVGWAHESNGQFLQDTGDANAFRRLNDDDSLDGHYDVQDFASMGWDYWWVSYIRRFNTRTILGIEYRFHVAQMSEFQWPHLLGSTSGIEDEAFFDGKKHKSIKEVDGLRIQLTQGLPTDSIHWLRWWKSPRVSGRLIFPEIGYGKASDFYDPDEIPFAVELAWEAISAFEVPIFISYSKGRLSSPARFDDKNHRRFNIGVILPFVTNKGWDLGSVKKWRILSWVRADKKDASGT